MIRLGDKGAARSILCIYYTKSCSIVNLENRKSHLDPARGQASDISLRSGAGSSIVERTAAAKCGAYSKHLACNKEAFRNPSRSNVKLGGPIGPSPPA